MTALWTLAGVVFGVLLHRYGLRLYDRWWARRYARRLTGAGWVWHDTRIRQADGTFKEYGP